MVSAAWAASPEAAKRIAISELNARHTISASPIASSWPRSGGRMRFVARSGKHTTACPSDKEACDGRACVVAPPRNQSLVDRGVDHVAHQRAVADAFRGRLHHEDHEHVFLRIDPEGGAPGAAPVIFAGRAVGGGESRLAPHRETQAE